LDELALHAAPSLVSLDAAAKAPRSAGAGAALHVGLELRDRRQALRRGLSGEPLDRLADHREVQEGSLDAGRAQPATDHHFVAFEGH
jgi:hypothetical protein